MQSFGIIQYSELFSIDHSDFLLSLQGGKSCRRDSKGLGWLWPNGITGLLLGIKE